MHPASPRARLPRPPSYTATVQYPIDVPTEDDATARGQGQGQGPVLGQGTGGVGGVGGADGYDSYGAYATDDPEWTSVADAGSSLEIAHEEAGYGQAYEQGYGQEGGHEQGNGQGQEHGQEQGYGQGGSAEVDDPYIGDWSSGVDPDSGLTYWYNSVTHESRWDGEGYGDGGAHGHGSGEQHAQWADQQAQPQSQPQPQPQLQPQSQPQFGPRGVDESHDMHFHARTKSRYGDHIKTPYEQVR